jgi:hypothetical protein
MQSENVKFLSKEECRNLSGGSWRTKVKCLTGALFTGDGLLRTGLLGGGLFGVARMIGVAAGCAGF